MENILHGVAFSILPINLTSAGFIIKFIVKHEIINFWKDFQKTKIRRKNGLVVELTILYIKKIQLIKEIKINYILNIRKIVIFQKFHVPYYFPFESFKCLYS